MIRALDPEKYDVIPIGDGLGRVIAEIIRQTEMPQIRAIAYETLAMMPISAITPLLDDPLYSGIGANSLEQKAYEFDSDEAKDILEQFDAENDTAAE